MTMRAFMRFLGSRQAGLVGVQVREPHAGTPHEGAVFGLAGEVVHALHTAVIFAWGWDEEGNEAMTITSGRSVTHLSAG